MFTIGVSDFRSTMNAVLKKVQDGEIVVLTSRGVEIAKLVPPDYAQTAARQELKILRESAIVGDVISPVEDEDSWKAMQ